MTTTEAVDARQLANEVREALAGDPSRCANLGRSIGSVDGTPEAVVSRLEEMGPKALCGVAQQWLSTPFIYDDGRLVADYYRVNGDGGIEVERPAAAPSPGL